MNYGHPAVQEVCGAAEVIVVQRNLLIKDVWDACDYWRGLGKVVVADLDDDYPHLCPQNPAYRFWIQDATKLKERTGYTPIEALTEGFRHVDALVSPNELILQDWSEILPGYWLPNYAQWKWWKKIKQKTLPVDDEPIVIGWGGSVSHFDGFWFSGLREAIPIINREYPRVMWKICGGDKRIKKFFDDLAPGRWTDQEGVTPDLWPQQVASFDVGIAPLCGPGAPQAESYDQHRSWLKSVEYLLAGVPWVASDGIVYEKLDGRGGFLVENSGKAWTEGLRRVLDDLERYKATSKKAMLWAKKNLTIEYQADEYMAVFDRIHTDTLSNRGTSVPNVHYAREGFEVVDPVDDVEVLAEETDLLPALLDYQRQTFNAVQDWRRKMGAEQDGVEIWRCLEFPILQLLNTAVYPKVTQ